jgi:FMN phosphatase YigB (HAD superfamily)
MPAIKAIFFDASDTLFHLPKGVGHHYCIAGRDVGLQLDEQAVNRVESNAAAGNDMRAARK